MTTDLPSAPRRFLPRWLATLLALPAILGQAQTAAPAAPPAACKTTEYRQFDFWIGTWDVYQPNGKKGGESRIEPIASGCALLENWEGSGGFSGKSLNNYDQTDKRWHQIWVDSSGSRLVLAGTLIDKQMVLSSDPAVAGPLQRITWTPNDDGSVRQLWESSADAGKTWTVAFDGKYVRRK